MDSSTGSAMTDQRAEWREIARKYFVNFRHIDGCIAAIAEACALEREKWVTLWKRHEDAYNKGILTSSDGTGTYNIEQEAYAAIRALGEGK